MKQPIEVLRAIQCRRNIEAIFLQKYNLCPPTVFATHSDRTTFLADESFRHDFLIHVPSHFSIWNAVSNHQVEEAIAMGNKAKCGWQENVMRFSLQIIQYADKVNGKYFLEGDVDYWNKNFGVLPIIAHGGEVGYNKIRRILGLWLQKKIRYKTDPFKVMNFLVNNRFMKILDVRNEFG